METDSLLSSVYSLSESSSPAKPVHLSTSKSRSRSTSRGLNEMPESNLEFPDALWAFACHDLRPYTRYKAVYDPDIALYIFQNFKLKYGFGHVIS